MYITAGTLCCVFSLVGALWEDSPEWGVLSVYFKETSVKTQLAGANLLILITNSLKLLTVGMWLSAQVGL